MFDISSLLLHFQKKMQKTTDQRKRLQERKKERKLTEQKRRRRSLWQIFSLSTKISQVVFAKQSETTVPIVNSCQAVVCFSTCTSLVLFDSNRRTRKSTNCTFHEKKGAKEGLNMLEQEQQHQHQQQQQQERNKSRKIDITKHIFSRSRQKMFSYSLQKVRYGSLLAFFVGQDEQGLCFQHKKPNTTAYGGCSSIGCFNECLYNFLRNVGLFFIFDFSI